MQVSLKILEKFAHTCVCQKIFVPLQAFLIIHALLYMDQTKLDKLIENRDKAMAGGGEAAVEKHRAKGSYTARERINMLLDEGSFEEVNMFLTHRCHDFGMEKKVFLGDGVAVGSGTIDGRLVFVFAQDATVVGGSLSETMAQKI